MTTLWPEPEVPLEDLFLSAEERQAVEVLRAIGAVELLAELGPGGATVWLAESSAMFAGYADQEIEAIANGTAAYEGARA